MSNIQKSCNSTGPVQSAIGAAGLPRSGGLGQRSASPRKLRLAALAMGLPAALITGALFIAMGRIIAVEYAAPQTHEVRTLSEIRPRAPEISEPRSDRRMPASIESIAPPPATPPLRDLITQVDLPAGSVSGRAPERTDFGRMQIPVPGTPMISARDLQPLRPPVASYPDSAARAGLEGDCDVHLKVNRRGEPFDVEATCTSSVFERAAERAVEQAAFMPRIVRGEAVEVHGVIYPMAFRLEDE